MRLLNTSTLTLENFISSEIPLYTILSHIWDKNEPTFQEFNTNTATDKHGYEKIWSSAAQARKDGHKYIWIDTICIDKSSSAELSEGINSMFSYYKNAKICYVYLKDVYLLSEFPKSAWFTRGWTLQELLAPKEVEFFNRDWHSLGSKSKLKDFMSAITRIAPEVLEGQDLKRRSIAQRMSWAASRETTRAEDIAYCLMGIFDVNMPLLYGEGREKAFIRLQQEIVKNSDDLSIFAWKLERRYAVHGLFATSPAAFADSHHIIALPTRGPAMPYSLTNRGLRIQLPLAEHLRIGMHAAALNCIDQRTSRRIGIYLIPLGEDRFIRTRLDKLPEIGLTRLAKNFKSFEQKTLYVPQQRLTATPSSRRLPFRWGNAGKACGIFRSVQWIVSRGSAKRR